MYFTFFCMHAVADPGGGGHRGQHTHPPPPSTWGTRFVSLKLRDLYKIVFLNFIFPFPLLDDPLWISPLHDSLTWITKSQPYTCVGDWSCLEMWWGIASRLVYGRTFCSSSHRTKLAPKLSLLKCDVYKDF